MTNDPTATERTILSERTFSCTRERMFRAWTTEEVRLWWGPTGFSNHFFTHDVRPGGEWRFMMRGPDGKEYPNRSVFSRIVPDERIEFDHFGPDFHTTVIFTETAAGTHVRWTMEFPTVREYQAVSPYAIPGNEQNLDRLAAFIAAPPLVAETVVDAPVSFVWTALTDPSMMKQWYFDLPGFRAEKGYRFEFDGGPPEKVYRHLCEVTEVLTKKRLSYTWRYDGYVGNSLVQFELFGEGEKTMVRLVHTGLETFPDDQPAFARANFAAGWEQIIGTSLAEFTKKQRSS